MKSRGIKSFAVAALMVAMVAAFLGPLQLAGADTFTAANKFGIAASDLQKMNSTQEPNDSVETTVELFSSKFKTSTQRDLIMTLSMECGLYTAVGAKGNYDLFDPSPTPIQTSSTATGQVIAWLELDGKALPTTQTSKYRVGDPNGSPPTTGNGPVVMCNRAFNVSTENFLEPQLLTLFIKTRAAQSFTWFATNVGNGEHTLVAKAKLVSTTASSDGESVTIDYVTPAASALVGQRTLVVEPVALQNSASY